MGIFTKFLTEEQTNIDSLPREKTVEDEVQDFHFGVNDYSPFRQDETNLNESVEPHPTNDKRLVFKGVASSKTGASGIVVPKHMWEGGGKTLGMKSRNEMRAKVYGSEHRPPLTVAQVAKVHEKLAQTHFAKPEHEQIEDEKNAIARLKAAGHLHSGRTLDKSEKTDTIRFEKDEEGRPYDAASQKGVAGHALYTSGSGEHERHHIINTCPGQTEGCGGGVDEKGMADTSRGTCFAPQAEIQYKNAAIRRAAQTQAKHDPAMTEDWFKAHTHSLRKAAENADRKSKDAPEGRRFVFRPNVVDETDRSSRFAIAHINKQRAEKGKPSIVSYQYSKANELNDPENGIHVTHSNVGPKVKNGKTISENVKRDPARVRQSILSVDSNGEDIKNDQGKKVPPKNSYLVNNLVRGGKTEKDFHDNVNHIKYWSTGRNQDELSEKEAKEGDEGHFDGKGKATTPDKAHYGHITMNGKRFDYQKQHVLHPRMVNVNGHEIPSDSRFKDNDYLPKGDKRFKTKNGKEAGAVVVTSPTTSTGSDRMDTSFTHHVDADVIKKASHNGGEWEIDSPHEQESAQGKEYSAPQPIKIVKKKK